MQQWRMPSIAPVALVAVALVLTPAAAASLRGHWSLELDPGFSDSPATVQCDIAQDDRRLTLDCDGFASAAGTISEAAVTFVIMTGESGLLPARFAGTVNANQTVI